MDEIDAIIGIIMISGLLFYFFIYPAIFTSSIPSNQTLSLNASNESNPFIEPSAEASIIEQPSLWDNNWLK